MSSFYLYSLAAVLLGIIAGVAGSYFSAKIIDYYHLEIKGEDSVPMSKQNIYLWIISFSVISASLIYYMRPDLGLWGVFPVLSFTALISLSVIDFEFMAVPDSLNFSALALAIIQPEFIQAAINAVSVFVGFFIFTKLLSMILKKEAMGSADLIIGATMAALLGIDGFLVALFFGAIISGVAMAIRRNEMEPFIPYLALSTFLCFIFIDEVRIFADHVVAGTLF